MIYENKYDQIMIYENYVIIVLAPPLSPGLTQGTSGHHLVNLSFLQSDDLI